jgi:formate dehydrogenase subunit gamma
LKPQNRKSWCGRGVWISLAAMLLVITLAPFSGLLLVDGAVAQSGDSEVNVRSEYWRAVRQGEAGFSTTLGNETGVLIQHQGENWRALREGPIKQYGGYVLLAAVVLIALFFALVGRIKLEGGRDFMTIERWSVLDRTLHWITAISFIILTVTGLSLLFGREVLIPVIGPRAFAAYASLSLTVHNYLGPLFAVTLIIQLLKWLPHNIPKSEDFVWFMKGGGMIGKSHPSAGRMNGGEKLWYWLLFIVGGVLVGSGLFLDFPIFGQTRAEMQQAHLLHAISSVVLIAVALGHIYIGTIGTEASLEGMVKGRVDTKWAKQHHDLWYEEQLAKGVKPVKATDSDAPPQAAPSGQSGMPAS